MFKNYNLLYTLRLCVTHLNKLRLYKLLLLFITFNYNYLIFIIYQIMINV